MKKTLAIAIIAIFIVSLIPVFAQNTAKIELKAAREELREAKQDLKEAKEKKDEKAIFQAARNYLLHIVDAITNHLEKLKIKAQEGKEAKIVAEINAQMNELNSIKAKTEASNTKGQLKEVARELRAKWNILRHLIDIHSKKIIAAKIDAIIHRSSLLEKRLDEMLKKAEEKGIVVNVSAELDLFNEKIALAGNKSAEAQVKLSEAMELTEKNGTNTERVRALLDEAKELLKEAKTALREAHEILKDMLNKIKEAKPEKERSIIGGIVFNDNNGNSIRNFGDKNLVNWTVFLDTNNNAVMDGSEQSTTTDADGRYKFEGLAKGNYMVREVVQQGWMSTTPNPVNAQVANDGHTRVDFGNFELAEIFGTVFEDMNGNGIFDANDMALANQTVTLLNNSEVQNTSVTDSKGSYRFASLGPGSYSIKISPQQDWIITEQPPTITVKSGQLVKANIGIFKLGSISGIKFNDLNGNGIKDENETILANWTIRLNGPIDEVATTDSNGFYSFVNLTAGTYRVRENLQTGWIQTTPNETYTLGIQSGTIAENVDFGNFKLGEIHGVVFNDTNNNTARDINETGLADWTIILTGSSGNITTKTNASGEYWFMKLEHGDYTVSEVLQEGWYQTFPALGTYTIAVRSGLVSEGNDFGNIEG